MTLKAIEQMLYPIKFEPFLREMVWGGEKILPFKGIETPVHHIGESWEISAVEEHPTCVAEGPLKGLSVKELVQRYKGGLVGGKVYETYGDTFPLLVKFIDAAADLSIQVHPDDALAAVRHGGQRGKTEMWYVIGAEPGACLYSGLSREVSPEELASRAADGTITEVLARYEVQPGDVFFLPAGRIHAICRGCMVAEIQETSDLTYRLYDYGRPGLDGKPRQLHTALAMDAIDYRVLPSYRTEYTPVKNTGVELVRCPYFTTSVYDLDAPLQRDLSRIDSFVVVMCLSGSGAVDDTPIRQGETLLIPASSPGVRFLPGPGGMKLLTSHL